MIWSLLTILLKWLRFRRRRATSSSNWTRRRMWDAPSNTTPDPTRSSPTICSCSWRWASATTRSRSSTTQSTSTSAHFKRNPRIPASCSSWGGRTCEQGKKRMDLSGWGGVSVQAAPTLKTKSNLRRCLWDRTRLTTRGRLSKFCKTRLVTIRAVSMLWWCSEKSMKNWMSLT